MKEKLIQAISEARDEQTCYPGSKDLRSFGNKSMGQCVVTALVLQDYLGGELLYNTQYHHYWNRLPDGGELDITKDQFDIQETIAFEGIKDRNELLSGSSAEKAKTLERYKILKDKVMAILQNK